jgi:glycosyltransferase involved in cell wall biosynthesis
MSPTVALVHDNFTGPTGMGLVLERHARWVLDAGWDLVMVGDNIPNDLAAAGMVHPAPKPRGLPSFAEHLEWCRRARRALRNVRADVTHCHSPLLAGRTDLLTAHFIAKPAHARGVREDATGVEGALRRAQGWASLMLDDTAYRRIAGRRYVSFVSEFLREEYRSCYGEPRGGWILPPAAPPWAPPADADRAAARDRVGIRDGRISVGFVGGTDPRKGYRDVLSLAEEPDLQLLLAGPKSETVGGLGFVDMDAFLPACDVVIAPSKFDSAPIAVLQAIAKGIPVVSSPTLGWARPIERFGCGVVWDGSRPVADAVREAARVSPDTCRALIDDFAPERQSSRLIEVYETILAERTAG